MDGKKPLSMAKRVQLRRLLALAALLGVAFGGLGYRLVDLQVLRHTRAQAETWTNTHHVYQLEPRRGDILDARGNLLATSVFVKTVCANPSLLAGYHLDLAKNLAPLLDMDPAELAIRLAPRTRVNDKNETVTNSYVLLKKKVSAETWQKVRDFMTNYPPGMDPKKLPRKEASIVRDLRSAGIYAETIDDQQRVYPNRSLAAHVLGYTAVLERTNSNGGIFFETAGVEGIERTLNPNLKGIRGWRLSERDGHRKERVDLREEDVNPHDGLNVVLTIDSVLQGILESAMAEAMVNEKPISISGMMVRPRTGEVLAMANFPTFDPNKLETSNESSRHNRIITDSHEPGSTFKIVVISGALNDNLYQLTDKIDCEMGKFQYAGHILHDSSPHPVLSVEGILMKSSNIGAAKVGIRMTQPSVYRYMKDFGFGVRTGIALPGEVPGIFPKVWYPVSIAQVPMGQGVSVTSMQLTMAMAALANQGVLMRPMLVSRLVDQNGKVVARYSPEPIRRVISEAAALKMVQALKTVVGTDGTAPKAAMEHYAVAGKTGTAQKPPYSERRWYASFVGFFPADNPEVCIYISMDEPKGPSHLHQGGQVCAPVFHQVAEKVASYLNIPPDKVPEAPLPTGSGTVESRTFQTATGGQH